ncbi:MAG: ABC transporter permease, partial [Firmicutes bacterium]|nr:ABC transporter permease [Bacillota bacterium]
MADGIKDKVAIVGMGCTKFGERWDKSAEDLMVEAFVEALEDAGIEKKDIQAAWLGIHFDEISLGKGAIPLATTLKLPFIPVTRVDNYCATGSEAFRGACYAVASGACDIALAVGVEKLKDTGYGGLPGGAALGTRASITFPNLTAPGSFAMMATRYFSRYGLSPEEGKMTLAKISAKSHYNGSLNPKAHLRRPVTVEQIMQAPIIAWPLGLFDCCGVSDGSAVAIVTRPEIAKKLRPDPIYVKALQIAASSGEEMMYNWDGTHVETTTRAAIKAYEEAGIKNPREELSMFECHDCFSITEMVTYEDLQKFAEANSAEITAIAPQAGGTVKVKVGNKSRDTSLIGTSPEYERVRNVHVQSGRFLLPFDVDYKQKVALLGTAVVNDVFEGANPLGKTIKINGQVFKVVGVLEERSNGQTQSEDDQVIIPVTVAQRLMRSAIIRN